MSPFADRDISFEYSLSGKWLELLKEIAPLMRSDRQRSKKTAARH